jgi:(p)ppGpp synthase/HD superfamily hydrolase
MTAEVDLRRVDAFAKRAHHGQTRNTGDNTAPEVPYIVHPRAVRRLLASHPDPAVRTPWVQAVGLLHDVLEDCDVSRDELQAAFGEPIEHAVWLLSKELKAQPGSHRDDYWEALAAAPLVVRQVKAADRIDNLRSCLKWHRVRLATKYLDETPRKVLPLVVEDAHLYATLARLLARVREAYPEVGRKP